MNDWMIGWLIEWLIDWFRFDGNILGIGYVRIFICRMNIFCEKFVEIEKETEQTKQTFFLEQSY